MPVTLRFTLPGSSTETLLLDATLSEEHSSSAQVTEFPVETGTNVSDHVRQLPDRLRVEGVVSNTPLPSHVSQKSRTFEEDMRSGVYAYRAENAYYKLKSLLTSAVLVTISTDLCDYDSMVLDSLTVPRSVETGDAVSFSACFVHVVTVSTKTVELAKSPKPKKVSTGKQPKKQVEEAQTRPKSPVRTVLKSILGG